MSRKHQMARIIRVAEFIHREPRKWTRPRLAEHFQVDKSTIQRDINLLCEMGIRVAVLFRKHAWYVIGRSETFNRVLTFRINRIDSLALTNLEYKIPEDFSVQRYLAKSWDVMLGPDTRVVIFFDPRIAPLIREVNWHPTQQIKERPDGVLHFEVTVAGWQEIGWWVLGWGHEAAVVKPKALQEWIAQTAQRMVKLYGEN